MNSIAGVSPSELNLDAIIYSKKLPQEHQYRVCQLITIVVRHVRKYVGEDAPSDRYVRKELPTKYKVEYRVKNAELQAKDTLKSIL